MTYDETLNIYDEQIKIVKMDQGGKLFRDDDHGVMDCSADIRELKAEKRGFIKGYKAGVDAGFSASNDEKSQLNPNG